MEPLENYNPKLDLEGFEFPPLSLLKKYKTSVCGLGPDELKENESLIKKTLGFYNFFIQSIKSSVSPTITLYEIVPKPGMRISKIKGLENDIALALSAPGVRIIAPMPGKGTIGIEVPNVDPEIVSMHSIISSKEFKENQMELPFAMGKTISNEIFITDLTKMPHLLMAGATGQGKSVGLNALIISLLFKKHPSQLKFVLVDPKKIELSLYSKIEKHYLAKLPGEADAVITDYSKALDTLNSLCIEMDNRYDLLKLAAARNIKEYNNKFVTRTLDIEAGHQYLPYIVLVIDEFADLMMTAGKIIEPCITRLAQLARAVGIHLVLATQRPTVNIITGTIKANFPARLAFKVMSGIDSRTILDVNGAEQLMGRGDMLLTLGSDLIRLQCAFVDTPEVEAIAEFIGNQKGYPETFILPGGSPTQTPTDNDTLLAQAARHVVQGQYVSTASIQKKLKITYLQAGVLIDQLELFKVISPFDRTNRRQILISDCSALEQVLGQINYVKGWQVTK